MREILIAIIPNNPFKEFFPEIFLVFLVLGLKYQERKGFIGRHNSSIDFNVETVTWTFWALYHWTNR